jgi:predicted phage terminase large subunit-like protein
MQSPAPLGGGLIKRKWFRLFKAVPKVRRLIQSWDTGFKEDESNDFSVCQTWAETELGFFMLDQWREKVEMPELKRAALWLYVKWQPMVVVIEDKASGQSLIQELRRPPVMGDAESRMLAPTIPVLPWKVETDKVSRAAAVSPLIEGGIVWLPADAPWLDETDGFFYEVTRFPKAVHDDQVDAMTMALSYLRGSGNMIEYYRQQVEMQAKEADKVKETGEPSPATQQPNSLVEIYKKKLEELRSREGAGGSAATVHSRVNLPLLPGLRR